MMLRLYADSWAVAQHKVPLSQPSLVKEVDKFGLMKWPVQEVKGICHNVRIQDLGNTTVVTVRTLVSSVQVSRSTMAW